MPEKLSNFCYLLWRTIFRDHTRSGKVYGCCKVVAERNMKPQESSSFSVFLTTVYYS